MSKITGEIPREKLKELVQRTGETLLQDPDRCEGLLKDHCGSHRKEISALVGALEERVPLELKSSWQSAMTPEAMRARLVQRLEENRGLAPDVATSRARYPNPSAQTTMVSSGLYSSHSPGFSARPTT